MGWAWPHLRGKEPAISQTCFCCSPFGLSATLCFLMCTPDSMFLDMLTVVLGLTSTGPGKKERRLVTLSLPSLWEEQETEMAEQKVFTFFDPTKISKCKWSKDQLYMEWLMMPFWHAQCIPEGQHKPGEVAIKVFPTYLSFTSASSAFPAMQGSLDCLIPMDSTMEQDPPTTCRPRSSLLRRSVEGGEGVLGHCSSGPEPTVCPLVSGILLQLFLFKEKQKDNQAWPC